MFQYAAGMAVSKRLQVELYLNIPAVERIDHAKFGLNVFNLDLSCFKFTDEFETIGQKLKSNLQTLKTRRYGYEFLGNAKAWTGLTYEQSDYSFESGFHELTSPCLITGYFQSEKFFKNFKREVMKAFDLSHFELELDEELKFNCSKENSVAVHIRRGDYATNPTIRAWHGLIEKEYYDKAREVILKEFKDATFVVFSDDTEVARTITNGWSNVYIAQENRREIDLLAMTLCHHNIIANSTFSWWGAWLNSNDEKIVISPQKWLLDEKLNSLCIANLIPESWNLL